jgi:hypothetical protein
VLPDTVTARPARRRAPVAEAVEVARQRLRRGHRLEAAELLDRCVKALAEAGVEDRDLAERRAYAHDRCTGDRGSSLAPEVVQRVVVWVTREELEEGRRELAADRPFAAARCFAAADAIDTRGTRSAYLHATALHRAAVTAVRQAGIADTPAGPAQTPAEGAQTPAEVQTPAGKVVPAAAGTATDVPGHLERAERCLRRAVPLARRALTDPALDLAAEELLATVGRQLEALDRRRATAARMAAACACLVDYEALVQHRGGRALTASRADRDTLGALAGRITRLRAGAPPGSAEARLLATLAAGVADLQADLPAYVRGGPVERSGGTPWSEWWADDDRGVPPARAAHARR